RTGKDAHCATLALSNAAPAGKSGALTLGGTEDRAVGRLPRHGLSTTAAVDLCRPKVGWYFHVGMEVLPEDVKTWPTQDHEVFSCLVHEASPTTQIDERPPLDIDLCLPHGQPAGMV